MGERDSVLGKGERDLADGVQREHDLRQREGEQEGLDRGRRKFQEERKNEKGGEKREGTT